jgi:hypothetical protein
MVFLFVLKNLKAENDIFIDRIPEKQLFSEMKQNILKLT